MIDNQNELSNEICELILENAKSGARHFANKHRITDVDELESFLVMELYKSLSKNENMRNVAGIRHIISKRWNNWVKRYVIDPRKKEISIQHMEHKMTKVFDGLEHAIDLSAATSRINGYGESGLAHGINDPINTIIENSDLYDFLDTLSERERKVIELTAGFTDLLDEEELERVHQLIERKSICSCGVSDCHHSVKIWFTETEVGHVLGLSRRQVQYITGKESTVRQRAIEFGLKY